MDNGAWATVISIIALYISVLSMTRSMRQDLLITGCTGLFVVFFKPIVLLGATGLFRGIANLMAVISFAVVVVLLLVFTRVPSDQKPWALITLWSAPALARVIYWVLGFRSSMAVRADIPTYLQLLSAEHKITLNTFQVLATHYPTTLYLAFGISQVVLWTFVVYNLSLATPEMFASKDFSKATKGWVTTVIITLVLLPTDWLRTGLVKLLSYFF